MQASVAEDAMRSRAARSTLPAAAISAAALIGQPETGRQREVGSSFDIARMISSSAQKQFQLSYAIST